MFAFYPAEGQPEVQLANVGIAGHGGMPLERAALSMSELQEPELDDQGDPTGERIPLTGDKLLAAAQAFAKAAGLVVADHEGTIPAEPPADTSTAPSPAVVIAPAADTPGVNAPVQE